MGWRLIQKYDDISDVNALLEWAKPRCAPKKPVKNFQGDWQDGTAFLALFESIKPGHIDWGNTADPEKNLELAFKLFLEHLGVSKMLEPSDLLEVDMSDNDEKLMMKQNVMLYVGAIRDAMAQADGAGDDKLYMEANARYAQALHDGNDDETRLFQE